MINALHSRQPFVRAGLARRSAPFLALLVLGFALFSVGSPRQWWYFAAALAVAVTACLLALLVPWTRLPDGVVVVAPLLCVGSVALLRKGQAEVFPARGRRF